MTALPNPFDQSSSHTGGFQEASAAADPNTAAVELLAEIELALADEAESRFVLDVPAFMEALEEPPLFLRN